MAFDRMHVGSEATVLMWSVLIVTVVTFAGGGVIIAQALRSLYKREGAAFAAWHKRRLYPGLAMAAPVLAVAAAIGIGVSLEAAELLLIGAGLVLEAMVVGARLGGKRARGLPLQIASLPERKASRWASIAAMVAIAGAVAAIIVDRSICVIGVARVVALLELCVAGVLLRPTGSSLFEAGVSGPYGFTPWDRLEAYTYHVFDRTAVIHLQRRTPRWLEGHITVAVPRSELEAVVGWLSQRLPCLAAQDVARVPGMEVR